MIKHKRMIINVYSRGKMATAESTRATSSERAITTGSSYKPSDATIHDAIIETRLPVKLVKHVNVHYWTVPVLRCALMKKSSTCQI